MFYKYLYGYIIFFLLLFSCSEKKVDIMEVKLNKSLNGKIAFDNYYLKFPFRFFHEKYPKFYKNEISKYKNLPNKDFYMVIAYSDNNNFLYNLHKEKLIENDVYTNLSQRSRLDSVLEKKKKMQLLTGVTGLENGKQFFIMDANKNHDFGDEKKVFLNSDQQHQEQNISEYNYEFSFITNDINEYYKRKISIFSNPDYYYFQHLKDSMAKNLGVVGKFIDYWRGSITLGNSSKYDIAVQGFNSLYINVLIKPDSLTFSEKDEIYNSSFSYKLRDTIKLTDDWFTLDSINNQIGFIKLKKIYNKDINDTSGWRLGDSVDNLRLSKLSNNSQFFTLSKSRKYTLLDFWGTWCSPCTEMTPRLIDLHNNFGDKVDIVGIAFDKSKEVVENYTKENGMAWQQTYISSKEYDNPILKKLKVIAYPTLILLDTNNKILYRGSGINSLSEIENIINQSSLQKSNDVIFENL